MVQTVSEVGEFGLISLITERFAQAEHVLVGPGDDAALIRIRQGHVVASADMMVEGRHFRRDWVGGADVGHRAAAQNLSDINAMGGTAHTLTLSLGLPTDLPVSWVTDFADGFAAEAALVGASVVGGDVTSCPQIVVAVSVLGAVRQAPVLRSGARVGDTLAIAGRQGWAAGGLAVLGRGFRSPRVLVDAYRRPEPPYAAGPLGAEAGATSMIDVSDGLLSEVGHLAGASGVAIDVQSASLEVPEALNDVAAATGMDALSIVLGGGDDHALLATFPGEPPAGWRAIGTVLEGSGVTVDGAPYDGPTGWRHF